MPATPAETDPLGLLPASRSQQLDAVHAMRPHDLPGVPDPDAVGRAMPRLRARDRRLGALGAGGRSRRPPRAKKTGMRRSRRSDVIRPGQRIDAPRRHHRHRGDRRPPLDRRVLHRERAVHRLAALPDVAWQVWRYVTSAVAYPAGGGPASSSTLLSIAIFVYISWGAERQFGRRRFVQLFLFSSAAAAALSLLVGIRPSDCPARSGVSPAPTWCGLAAPRCAQPAADQPGDLVRHQPVPGRQHLRDHRRRPGGHRRTLLLRRYEDRRGRASTPYLIIGGAIAAVIVLAILRNTRDSR